MSENFSSDAHQTFIFSNIHAFSMGKNPPANEDVFQYNESTLVLSDGVTDKSGLDFDGQTGGKLAAQLVVDTCIASQANGTELVAEVTAKLKAVYEKINPKALEDSACRFAATLLTARIVDGSVIITQVGDSSFRINGADTYTNNKVVDGITAQARREYIKQTGDTKGSRDFIMPLLKAQHAYQNHTDHPLGYGIIDGTPVPEQFINVFSFPVASVHSIELVSDGYYNAFPGEVSIASYESLRRRIEEVDPHKCDEFAATKINDDRTVLIATTES